ncbi:MAG: Cna B-type domain-containing protein, partial [Clostridium sp.]|nr:Cna B-type domain-containing protein [Clostridium sp.]
QLYQDSVAYGKPVKLESGTETHIWAGLDLTDSRGNYYEYTVKEVEVPENYEKLEEKLTVTNTYVSPKTEITGTKVWIGGPEVKPTIELQLYRDNEAIFDSVELVDGETEYTWKDLDLTDKNGKEYDYTVKEVNVPENYEKVEEGLTVTNKYVSPKTEITGTKVWIGGPEKKPTIELQLYRNGEAFGDPVKLKDGSGEHVWKDLDLTDENGLEYKYTIDEINVPENYTKTLSEDGLKVTNKYSEPVKPTDPEKPTKPSEPGLPPTGTQSTIVFTLLGIMIVLIGMTLWFNERKRKSNTK